MSISVTVTGDASKIGEAVKALKSAKVLVGIPAERASRTGEGPNNAELMYIHTNGSPRLRIPARPIIEPAVEESMEQITRAMKAAAVAAIEGDMGEFEACLDDAGTYGENAAIQKFGEGLAPNAPITIEGGWMRNRISGKPFYIEGKGSTAPLIDTGHLKGAITHVIEKR